MSILYKVFFVLFFLFFSVHYTQAADFFIGEEINDLGLGQVFKTDIFINTESENLNTFSAKVLFSDNLSLKNVYSGSSIISFWIKKPELSEDGSLTFSGIIPGGYMGHEGFLFSLELEAVNAGQAFILIDEAQVFKHDGTGQALSIDSKTFDFFIDQETSLLTYEKQVDQEPPEIFSVEIISDENIFDGQWVAIFDTHDKGLGLDYYMVKESRSRILGFFKKWRIAESPLVLEDQARKSYLWIKAVDKAGNERVLIVPPTVNSPWYSNLDILLVISLIFLLLFIIRAFKNILYVKKR